MSGTTKGLQLLSLIKKSGELELSLAEVPIPEPGPDQVLVKVEATPINPSDLVPRGSCSRRWAARATW